MTEEVKKMNPEVKALWLTALRSGEYEQTESCLCWRDEHGKRTYCCLGVLTDLYIKSDANKNKVEWSDSRSGAGSLCYKDEAGYLHKEIVEWAGLERVTGAVLSLPTEVLGPLDISSSKVSLDLLNDCGMDFKKIADIIEKYL